MGNLAPKREQPISAVGVLKEPRILSLYGEVLQKVVYLHILDDLCRGDTGWQWVGHGHRIGR